MAGDKASWGLEADAIPCGLFIVKYSGVKGLVPDGEKEPSSVRLRINAAYGRFCRPNLKLKLDI